MRGKLGEGTFGEVYLASHTLLQKDVAIKMLTRIEEVHIKRFRVEASIAGKLKHENIASAISYGVNGTGNPVHRLRVLNRRLLKQRLADDPGCCLEALIANLIKNIAMIVQLMRSP